MGDITLLEGDSVALLTLFGKETMYPLPNVGKKLDLVKCQESSLRKLPSKPPQNAWKLHGIHI
jgi:hypothetical protein